LANQPIAQALTEKSTVINERRKVTRIETALEALCRQCCLSAAAIPHKRRHIIAYYTSTGWRYPSIHWHQFRIYSDTEISQQIWSCCQSPRLSAVSSSLAHRSPQANGQSIATMASA